MISCGGGADFSFHRPSPFATTEWGKNNRRNEMKVCRKCGQEIMTVDGENTCRVCKEKTKNARATQRRATDDVLRSLGLTKVKGVMGGVYWE